MWQQFLSSHRIGSRRSSATDVSRSEFHKDYDRIIFSSAFRRLADKTQVVPFPESDYTRQRLTHSLEVSCVGRSLATSVFEAVRSEIGDLVSQGDFEAIVAAACLAHDIGNPPFGHFGEKAIQEWAEWRLKEPEFSSLTESERADLTRFEGNAQSFRILTRLQMANRPGGMQLTAATLGALIKYPRGSVAGESKRYKKHGVFQDDRPLFDEVFERAGRVVDEFQQFSRHPLALLSEAADDICYAVIDLEDGCKAGLISWDEGLSILEGLRIGCTGTEKMPNADRLSMGRAIVIGQLVQQCAEVFQSQQAAILEGTFDGSLIDLIAVADAYKAAKSIAVERIFNSPRVLELEAAGYRAIQGLMQVLTSAALAESPSGFDLHIRKLNNLEITDEMSTYQKLVACTDQVSGMTDRYCVELFRRVSGQADWKVS
ncbi:MAG TPA: hypothetical protein DCG12_18165 [Planctomycetaceae bacterium]|nr:hypothetical protein [Planctomycetaceae bacterium]